MQLGLDIGIASRPHPAESVCGDGTYLYRHEGGCLLAMVDGLGHGIHARVATDRVCEAVAATRESSLVEIMTAADIAARGTRGAALSLIQVDLAAARLHCLGIGNVATLARSRAAIRPITRPGIVGARIRKMSPMSFDLAPGDQLVMYTDGISTRVCLDELRGAAQQMADFILATWSRAHDDATCAVVLL